MQKEGTEYKDDLCTKQMFVIGEITIFSCKAVTECFTISRKRSLVHRDGAVTFCYRYRKVVGHHMPHEKTPASKLPECVPEIWKRAPEITVEHSC